MSETNYKKRERDALNAPEPGFWLAACMMGVCDQALESHQDHARFYPGAPPEALINALRPDPDGERRSKRVSALFQDQALAELERQRPDCPFARRFLARARAPDFTIGLSMEFEDQHHDETPAYWGAIELCSSDCDYLMELGDEDYRSERADLYGWSNDSRAQALLSAAVYGEASLDALERALGLAPSELRVEQGERAGLAPEAHTSQVRWGDDSLPRYLRDEIKPAALALRERDALRSTALPGKAQAKPRV